MKKFDRFKYGIKLYGWDSTFRKEYNSLIYQLKYHEIDKFFDSWSIPKVDPQVIRTIKLKKILNKIKI